MFIDLLADVVFKESSFPKKYFFNRSLWKDIRVLMTARIFMTTLYSQNRALNLVEFFFNNLNRIFGELLMESNWKRNIVILFIQICGSKSQFQYLCTNGFLCWILDFVSCHLKKFGFGKCKDISTVLKKVGVRKIGQVVDLSSYLRKIFYFPSRCIDDSIQVRSDIQKAPMRLWQFVTDFDDMEPLTLKKTYKEDEITLKDISCVIRLFQNILVPYVRMIRQFDESGNQIIKELVQVFKSDMERVTANLASEQAIEKLLTQSDIENKPFSVFNLSQRLFFLLLTECVVQRKLSNELKKRIFDDHVRDHLFVLRNVVQSWSHNRLSNYGSGLASIYHTPAFAPSLFLPDFNAIQFLITCLTPEHFLKYLLFNVFPSIRQKTTVSEPFSSILSLPESEDTLVLQHIFILIYNAFTELRLICDLDDQKLYMVQLHKTKRVTSVKKTGNTGLRSKSQSDCLTVKSLAHHSNLSTADRISSSTPRSSKPAENEQTRTLSLQNLNPGSPFNYLNSIEKTKEDFETLLTYHRNGVPNFVLPDIVELRDQFKGMDDFLFSQTFFDFIMESFVKWYKNSELWKKDSPDLFLFILLVVCLILRVSESRRISDSQRERMVDFLGPHPRLENRSLFDIIKNERPNSANPLVASMIDRFINLSKIGQRNLTNI
ncbi:hypothetical protein RF11_04916 [Thelohanellus kitauei]|uniref:Uncharacterized protein n=1 Tax=Thelohanellus kitauei TaxID=669202 RepID=A0A0C2JYY4_THEKT|nr:hypothetical protein RF11_04916 [Thelohanellus kitauei]